MEMPICPQHLEEIDCYPWFEANPKISATDARTHVTGSSTSDNCSRVPCIGRSPVLDEPHGDKIPRSQPGCAERKRKPSAAGACFIAGKSQDAMESKKKPKVDGKKASEPPVDFIHVRARRGEATDSHSLAERVRRKKIGERMNVLQGLVPGCHQMKGKALILDEIINYVRSLQNQVEFLSMKLALLSPMLHDLDYLSGQPEVGEERFLALISVHYNLIPDDTRINHLVQDDSSFRIQDVEQEQRCLDEMEFDDMLLFSSARH
ncbi:hypothetical protein C4D60_Mb09t00960 [Musa balbisiana]|uniref:BHLH domain-containing protein n=1 Tax=Musa balbisiana TaxID=52838 RepID=A0A4S8ID31_MUSBA|nr:hypothetical protein C4D60_Mb09t00960 [Musa balbisiana]